MMQHRNGMRLLAGVFVLIALSISGKNWWTQSQHQALTEAVRRKDATQVQQLLSRDIPPDAGLPLGKTRPLHIAINNQDQATVNLLLDAHAEIDAPEEQGRTPLFLALAILPDVMLQKLLDKGASPNAMGGKTETCLSRAALLGRKNAIPLLLAHGAQLEVKDGNEETPLMAALRGALATGDLRVSPLNAPFTEDHFGVVQELLKAGAGVNGVNAYGMTPLMQAAIVAPRDERFPNSATPPPSPHSLELGKLLLTKGAKIDARMTSRVDSEGRTPLMLAANLGNLAFVRFLLEQGADPNLRSNTDKTALDYALKTFAKTIRAKQTFIFHQKPSGTPTKRFLPDEEASRYERLKSTIALLKKVTKPGEEH